MNKSNNLAEMNEPTRSTLANREAIAIDQDALGIPAWRAQNMGGLEVWQKALSNGDIAAGLFNRSDSTRRISAQWRNLGISGPWQVRDLWSHKDLGSFDGIYGRDVGSHEMVLLRLAPAGAATPRAHK